MKANSLLARLKQIETKARAARKAAKKRNDRSSVAQWEEELALLAKLRRVLRG